MAEQVLTDTVGILLSKQATQIDKTIDIANTILARDYKGFGNQGMNGVLEFEKGNKLQNIRHNDRWQMG